MRHDQKIFGVLREVASGDKLPGFLFLSSTQLTESRDLTLQRSTKTFFPDQWRRLQLLFSFRLSFSCALIFAPSGPLRWAYQSRPISETG